MSPRYITEKPAISSTTLIKRTSWNQDEGWRHIVYIDNMNGVPNDSRIKTTGSVAGPRKKKIYLKRPSGLQYIFQIFRDGLSLTFLKEALHLIAYYIINHVKGLKYANISAGARIRPTVLFRDAERIHIGKNSTINHNNVLWAGKESAVIRIGENVMTGPNVQMFAFDHVVECNNIPMIEQPFTESDIIIEDDVWIGAGSIILAGAIISLGRCCGSGFCCERRVASIFHLWWGPCEGDQV